MADKRQYLDVEGLDALWAKIKKADQENAENIQTVSNKVDNIETNFNDLSTTVLTNTENINKIQEKLEIISPESDVVYAEITKDLNGDYITSRGDRSAYSSTVVVALNDLKSSFESINISDYYTKNESDERFIISENFLTEEQILSIFNNN